MVRRSREFARSSLRYAGQMSLLQTPSVAIDGSKFKAVNNRNRNFTHAKVARRMAQIEESVGRYLPQGACDDQHPRRAVGRNAGQGRDHAAAGRQAAPMPVPLTYLPFQPPSWRNEWRLASEASGEA
jgi:hypothetical protein